MDWDRDDTDGDGIPNLHDNCPLVSNLDQADSDADGVGDVCDDDVDGDGIQNDHDDCPLIFNPKQQGAFSIRIIFYTQLKDVIPILTTMERLTSMTSVRMIHLSRTLTLPVTKLSCSIHLARRNSIHTG